MDPPRLALLGVALLIAIALGPWLARVAVRLAAREETARPSAVRTAGTTALLAGLLAGAGELTGLRPATVALAWAAGAGVVLGSVDLLAHRLPDRVTYPAALICAGAFLVDAAVLDSWGALVRGLAAGVGALAVAGLGWLVSPQGLGLGDVKLLGLLGLVLGWFGWGLLLTGVFLGLLTGAAVSLVLLAVRRVGWRTAIPFGPPLLAGAVLALAVGATSLGW
jgi:leader peptidase (prepilin peptidase)/N-methyltransferase